MNWLSLFNSRASLYAVAGLGLLSSFVYVKVSSYKDGYKAATEHQQLLQAQAEGKLLYQQGQKLIKEREEAIKSVQAQVKIETVYRDRVKVVEKIIYDNPKLSSAECSLSDEDFKKFNETLEEVQ